MAVADISLTSGMRGSLYSLQRISSDMARTQMRLSTGLKVNSALDNPTDFFAAQDHLNRASDLNERLDGVSEAIQTINAANDGITAISSLLNAAKGIASAAQGTNDQASRSAYSHQFTEILSQIDTIKGDSSYRGTNLLGSQSLTVDFAAITGQSTLTIAGFDASSSGLGLTQPISTPSITNTTTTTTTTATTDVSNNIALGGSDPVVINSDGTVTAVTNYGGVPLPPGLSGVVSVASGNGFSLALKGDGTVVGWGDDSNGVVTGAAALTNVTAISAGSGTGQGFGLALKSDGTVVGWGDNSLGQTNIPSGLNNVVAISAGYGFGLALKSDGTVVGWGDDSNGVVTGASALSNVTAISAGGAFGLALKSDGTVVGWGDDSNGVVTGASTLSNVKAISAGVSFGLALKNDGTVAGWGDDSATQIDITPGLNNVVAVAAGVFGGIAMKNDGSIVDWGALSPYPPLSGVKTTGGTISISTSTSTNTPGSGSNSIWSTDGGIQTSLGQLDTAIAKIRTISTTLSSNNNILTTRQTFTDSMINILQTGSDNLTLADMNEEGANMLMLQTRQSLATTSLSLGAQSAQAVLRLL